jgi:RNA-binding protein NOB1
MSLPATARWGSSPPVLPPQPVVPQEPKSKLVEGVKKSKRVVLDSGAIILGGRIERLGDEFWTIPEVTAEIKDENARMTLSSLPFELHFKEVDPTALAFVTRFSKLTGDFSRLSRTDLKVMALTYHLEKQFNGTDHLNLNPIPVSGIYSCKFFFSLKRSGAS